MSKNNWQKEISNIKVNVGKLETKLSLVHEDVKDLKKQVGNHITDMQKDFVLYRKSVDERFDKNKTWLVAILVSLIFVLLTAVGSLIMLMVK